MDIISYINDLFSNAIKNRASDIHIEPQAKSVRIRQRVDGFLVEYASLPSEHTSAILSRLKVMTNLDIGERRLPQDGSMTLEQDGAAFDVRISTIPTLYGEKIVMRLLHQHKEVVTLNQLGMAATERMEIEKLLACNGGLVIVTGPTGSGKTTTLYAMLQVLNRIESNVMTLEDPIELQLPGVNQIQIQPRVGFTFATGLRSILRQDPNVIMIGEIRDKETADIALSAALTGHLVLTTLHTKDAASAVTRLFDMDIEPYRVAAALSGVVAQRLVRCKCRNCNGEGCLYCQHTGYFKRTGIFEVISSDITFQEMISHQVRLSQLRLFFRSQGMRSLYDAAMEKVENNETTMEEIRRVIDDVEEEEAVLESGATCSL